MTETAQIQAEIARFIAAYNASDIAGVIGCYDETLIKLRQGAAPETRDETERRVAHVMAHYRGHVRVRNDEILVSGDLAVVRGEFTVELTPRESGEAQAIHRRFLEIWRKTPAGWRVFRTMDNSGMTST